MAFGFPPNLNRPKASPIAVDFGAQSLKLLQITPGDRPRLTAAAVAPVPEDARDDPRAREAFYAQALKTKLKSHRFKGRRVMLSLPAHQALVQNIQVPRCEPGELAGQVALHLQERLSLDPTRMVLRHFPVGEVVREGTARQEVVCIGAPRETVMRYIRLAQRCRLEVVGMHSEPPCLPLAFSHVYNRRAGDDQQVRCFVDIGAAATKVVISQGPRMVFAKTIHAAGDQMAQELARREGLSPAQARARRRAQTDPGPSPAPDRPGGADPPTDASASAGEGEPGDSSDPMERGFAPHAPGPGEGHAGAAAVAAAPRRAEQAGLGPSRAPADGNLAPGPRTPEANETLDCLIDELQLCARYYQAIAPGGRIDKLIFLGGESHHTGACQEIARRMRIAAQLGDPFARLERDHAAICPGVVVDQPQPGWAVPYGLCLSKANL